ncbi:MAG: DUF92 domain-containing protein, partial [Bryobacteraceae bacterium]
MRGIPVSKTPQVSRSDVLAMLAALVLVVLFLTLRMPGYRPSLLSIAVPVAFAAIAWLLQGVNLTGAIAGAAVAFIFYSNGGWQLFILLLIVFAITFVATKIGTAKKKTIEIRKGFGRSGSQVMANLFVAAAFLSIADVVIARYIAMGAAIAALAELAADTVSSELGEAFGRPTYLMTTWKPAATGTNGGISLLGTIAGIFSAVLVAAAAFALNILDSKVWICAVAGTVGMIVDSLLGATLENRGK